VGQTIGALLVDEGIRVVTGASALSVRREPDGVVASARVGGVTREFRTEKLLVATGRRPNTDHITIERAGVAIGDRGQVLVDEYLQTSVPRILAAGDVIGRETGSQMATPVGSHDGGIAAHNALSSEPPRAVNHRVIPRAIFTGILLGAITGALAASACCVLPALPGAASARTPGIEDKEARPMQQSSQNRNSSLLITLRDGVQPLQDAFNQEVSKTRLLLLVSPT
jgi:mercuric reductase